MILKCPNCDRHIVRWLGRTVLSALVSGAVFGACTMTGSPSGGTTHATTGPERKASAPLGVVRLVQSSGKGWSSTGGLEGPAQAPGSCFYRQAHDGQPLPDPGCTPGAIDSAVTQANLAGTICRSGGYTSLVRPPESLTEDFKFESMRAYDSGDSARDYELDHLVPLEVGGSSDTRNLWPEVDDHPSPGVANSKDLVEDELHDLVCNAVEHHPYVPLATAQLLIATDWTTAVVKAQEDLVGLLERPESLVAAGRTHSET